MSKPLSLPEIKARVQGLDLTTALAELQAMAVAGEAVFHVPLIAFTDSVLARVASRMSAGESINALDALSEVLAEVDAEAGGYTDPGEAGYCAQHENNVRSLMELTSFYDESGPRSDPSGDYLCGTCQLRKEPGGCLFVDGKISMATGSCEIYVIGAALPAAYELKKKYSQEEAAYAERPAAKGFGCKRCEYVSDAKAPDADGRKKWCGAWGVHVRKNACCARHDGNDMILPWQALYG